MIATHRKTTSPAFTIIELLIVIVIIAILASITIVAYNGITAKAHVTTLQSDLSQAATSLAATATTTGTFPTSQAAANLKSSPGDSFTYNVSGNALNYCLQASGWSMTYYVTDANNTPTAGSCQGTTGVAGSTPVNNAVMTTFAGSAGSAGFVNGTGTAAQFNTPEGMALDSAGNVYVADTNNNAIRKVTPAGVVTTYASVHDPRGIGIDSSGNLYVASYSDNKIYKVATNGTVTTFAGTGSAGNTNGPAASAQFNGPVGVGVDSSGNVYVADWSNGEIRKIDTSGNVTTLASGLNEPRSLAIDGSGNVYVINTGSCDLDKVTSSGAVSLVAGSTDNCGFADGTGSAAQFNSPRGLTITSNGTLYVADGGNARIRQVTQAGVVTTFVGNGTNGLVNGTGTSAEVGDCWGIVAAPSGALYVSDTSSQVIHLIQ